MEVLNNQFICFRSSEILFEIRKGTVEQNFFHCKVVRKPQIQSLYQRVHTEMEHWIYWRFWKKLWDGSMNKGSHDCHDIFYAFRLLCGSRFGRIAASLDGHRKEPSRARDKIVPSFSIAMIFRSSLLALRCNSLVKSVPIYQFSPHQGSAPLLILVSFRASATRKYENLKAKESVTSSTETPTAGGIALPHY